MYDRYRASGRLYRPPTALIVTFVDQHKEEYGVEPICEQLTELGCKFAPLTYYEARGRQPSKRDVRDETLKEVIAGEYRKNYSVYGPRKMWMHLRRKPYVSGCSETSGC